jgi:hypothetical protein
MGSRERLAVNLETLVYQAYYKPPCFVTKRYYCRNTLRRRRTLCLITFELPIIDHPLFAICSPPFMSHAHHTASSSSNQVFNFQLIINNALDEYKKRTMKDLRAHPLVTELQSCNTPSAILSVLQQQVQELDQSISRDERWSRWLDPTVNVLYNLSSTLAASVGLVRRGT